MWNENAPLELLKGMPSILNEANLARIQEVIDYDKYVHSYDLDNDLCGKYAPFCKGCDKTVKYPCAVAYVHMMQEQGMNIKIDEKVFHIGTAKIVKDK